MDLTNKEISNIPSSKGGYIHFIPKRYELRVATYLEDNGIEYDVIHHRSQLPQELDAPKRINFMGREVAYSTYITKTPIDLVGIAEDISTGKIVIQDKFSVINNPKSKYDYL